MVYSGIYRGERVAIKTVKNRSKVDIEELITEVCIHSKISVLLSGVIRLHGADLVCESIEKRCIVMECADGSLHDALYNKVPDIKLHLHVKLGIFLQVAHTMVVVHDLKIIHRDIKPANNGQQDISAKLSDFGLAKSIQDQSQSTMGHNAKGTSHYMAPELSQSECFLLLLLYMC